MNYLNEMIRRNTRDMLRRNWGKAVALTVTVMAVLLLGSMLESAIGGLTGTYGLGTLLTIYRSSLSALTPARLAASTALTLSVGLVELLLLCPLLLGISEWLTGLSYGVCENDMGSVFRHYRSPRRFFRAVWLYLNIAVRSWLYTTLLLLPGSLMIGASELFTRGNPSSLDRIMAVMGMAMGVCLLILGGITAWIFTRRYALAPYLVIRQDSLTARQAIRESIQATRGFKTSYAWFQFSFIGWWLFSLFMLPLFYTIPYVWGGNALYARTLLEARRVIPVPAKQPSPPDFFRYAEHPRPPVPNGQPGVFFICRGSEPQFLTDEKDMDASGRTAGPGEQDLVADAVRAQAVVAEAVRGTGGLSAEPQGIGRGGSVPGPAYRCFGGGLDLAGTAQHQHLLRPETERRQTVAGAVDVHQHPFRRDGIGTHQIPVGEQSLPVQFCPLLRGLCQIPVDHLPVPGVNRLGEPHIPDGGRASPGHRAALGQQPQRRGLCLLGGGKPLGLKAPAAQLSDGRPGQLFIMFLHQFLHNRFAPFSPFSLL